LAVLKENISILNGEDKILDYYRRQVDELIDNQYGPGISNPLNQEELDEMWEGISSELDIDEVWSKITNDLDIVMPANYGSGVIPKVIAFGIVLLISFIPLKRSLPDYGISNEKISRENHQNEQSAGIISVDQIRTSYIYDKESNETPPGFKSLIRNIGNGNKTTSIEKIRVSLAQESSDPVKYVIPSIISPCSIKNNVILNPSEYKHIKTKLPTVPIPEDLNKILISSGKDSGGLKINERSLTKLKTSPQIERKRISVGVTTSVKNTWLLNHETFNGLKSETLNSTELVFYPDFGLILNYGLSNNWSIQAGGFLFSSTGQEYLEYYNIHYIRKKIILRYSTVDFLVKYKFAGSDHLIHRSSVNVLAGGYFSFLDFADQKRNMDLQDVRSQYRNYDFGVKLGCEFEINISNRFSLAPGFSLSLGIPNIYKGDTYYSGDLSRTHNGSEGFHVSLYYHFD